MNSIPKKNLYDIKVNEVARIKELHGEPVVCDRLREMGFCENVEVKKVSHGSCLICHVCNVNVALSKYLAKNIVVETLPAKKVPSPKSKDSSS